VEEAAAKIEAETQKVKEAVEKAGAVIEAKATSAVAKASPTQGNVKQWANWMADQLRRVPDVKSYGTLKLRELGDKGPAAARGLWATARGALDAQYGNTTIDDLLAEFGVSQH
jgi:hypothetical protein